MRNEALFPTLEVLEHIGRIYSVHFEEENQLSAKNESLVGEWMGG